MRRSNAHRYSTRYFLPVTGLLVLILAGCVAPISATFKGFHDRSFSARPQPAQLHTGEVAELLQGNYLLIGHLDFTENIRSCYDDHQCSDISEEGPSAQNILKRAAELGGDLVSILDEQLKLEPVSKSHCTSFHTTTYTVNGQTYVNTSCTRYLYTNGFMESWHKRALVWRKEAEPVDPEANQRAMDAALRALAEDYAVRTDPASQIDVEPKQGNTVVDHNTDQGEVRDFPQVERTHEDVDPLLNAIVSSNFTELDHQKRLGILTAWRDNEGRNALMSALLRGKWDVVNWLLKNRHHWPGKDNKGFTTLQYATQFGSPATLKALIEATPARKLSRQDKARLLFFAAGNARESKNLDIIVKLYGERRVRTRSGATPLHAAALSGRRDLFDLLVKKGYSTRSTTQDGITLAMQAAKGGNRPILEYLLGNSGSLHQKDKNENTLLHYAAQSDDPDTLNWLIDQGLDINLRNKQGVTPLYTAIVSKNWETSSALMKRKPILNQNVKVLQAGMYVLITEKQSDLLKAFFERLLPFRGDHYYQGLLMLSAAKGNGETIKLFADRGFNLSLEQKGTTPLQLALKEGNRETTRELIRLGVDPHTKDFRGLTPLMRATLDGDTELVQLLRKGGAKF